MTKLANLVCVENIDITGKTTILHNPITVIELVVLPNNYTFYVNFSVVNIDKKLTKEDYVQVKFRDGNKEILMDTGKIEFPEPEEEDPISMTANIEFKNLTFSSEGLVEVELSSNLADSISTYFSVKTTEKK